MGLKDIKVPATTSDQDTTNAKTALPPVEFSLTKTATGNVLAIQDRQGPQDRVPTVSYRVYFLPQAFAPVSIGTTTTKPAPAVMQSVVRGSGRLVASLVADIKAPALGTVLNYTDSVNFGAPGYYYCVAVNRSGVEAPPEHIVATAGLNDVTGAAAATGGGGGSPIFTAVTSINGDPNSAQTIVAGAGISVTDDGVGGHTITNTAGGFAASFDTTWGGTITGAINGVNTGFTMTTGFGTIDLIFVDGIIDSGASAIGTALTVGTAPVSSVAVEHVA